MVRTRKSKPIAEHIEATSPETPPAENQAPPVVPETPEPETNEPAKTHADQVQPRRPHGEMKDGVPHFNRLPDPMGEYTIALTGDAQNGPQMRSFRNRRQHLMAIRFDEKPEKDVIDQLHEHRWRWQNEDKVWTKPLGDTPGVAHRQAQELFEKISSLIWTRKQGRKPSLHTPPLPDCRQGGFPTMAKIAFSFGRSKN